MRVNSVKNYAVNSNLKTKSSLQSRQAVSNISFGAVPFAQACEMVKRSMSGFKVGDVNVDFIQRKLASRGVATDFSQGNELTRRIVARGCELTSDIFEKLGFVQPKKLMTLDFTRIPSLGDSSNIVGFCTNANFGLLPVRTVAFNVSKDMDWLDMPNVIAKDYSNGFSSAGHILHPFTHEFAHSALVDNVYKRHGAKYPALGYHTNPNLRADLLKLQKEYGADPRLKATVDIIENNVSTYATTNRHETFAELLTKKILNDQLIPGTYAPLPLPKNPKIITPEDRIIYEIWNGLVNDGVGLV